jgi:formate dehydrogenase
MAKIVCVLYPDPVSGYPPKYLRDSIPSLQRYPDGQSLPTREAPDFAPEELVGCVSGELGLRKFPEDAGHTLVVISDKDGVASALSYTAGSSASPRSNGH